MREKYYIDNRIYNFETKIISKSEIEPGIFNLELEDTYFYPEGGGQPADKGFIDGFEVLDVQKIDGKVIHTVKGCPKEDSFSCSLDRPHRDHFMIQHTGQHLISGVLKHELDIDTLSVHLGLESTTIEIDKKDISETEIIKIEDKVYNLITNGNSVKYHETDDEGLKNFNIRRSSKYSGYIRIVEIEGYDSVPCGGVHLSNLSEIGLIKIIGFEKIRGNIRLNILIGPSAYKDYRNKDKFINITNRELSTKTEQIPDCILRLKKSISDLKLEKRSISNVYSKMMEDSIITGENVIYEFQNLPVDITQKIATNLVNTLQRPILILNISQRVNWYLLDSVDQIVNFNQFRQNILPIINGKGGGKKSIWQGSGEIKNIELLVKDFKSWVLTLQI